MGGLTPAVQAPPADLALSWAGCRADLVDAEPIPRKADTPAIPVCEAMAWIRTAMAFEQRSAGLGAHVPQPLSRTAPNVTGSHTRTSACGFASTLRRLLLKNCRDSATCVAST